MTDDSALWTWFVFYSGLSTQRAKALLAAWQAQDISLTEALGQLQSQTTRLGITTGEAGLLASGRETSFTGAPSAPALTWRDDLYPAGLHTLPLKIRPAVLFYHGVPSLLSRTLVYLAPGALVADAVERVREALNLLLGEHVLVAALEDTPQAALAMEEMITTEGELLLFAQSGLDRRSPSKLEQELGAQDRLVVLSPLPPNAPYQTSLDMILHQVAWYASDRVILTTDSEIPSLPREWLNAKPILELTGPTARRPHTVSWVITADPTDVLDWIEGLLTVSPPERTSHDGPKLPPLQQYDSPATQEAYELEDTPPLLPLSPEETLRTLERGGAIPEVLRRRILEGRRPV